MKDTEMDRILSKQDEILSSSGFAASVMEAVRREAAAPAPIPFPWKRALPLLACGAVALLLVAVVGVVSIVQLVRGSLSQHLATAPSLTRFMPSLQGPIGLAVGWTVLALLAAWVSVRFSMHLAGRRA